MRTIRTLGGWLLAGGCALLLAAALAVATGRIPLRAYAVQTGSMSPTIPPRSLVLVDPHAAYHPGDVITFTVGGRVLTHRLIGYTSAGLLQTKGDANRTPDHWQVRPADVRGAVVAAPRWLGYWLIFVRQPAGLCTLVLSAVWLRALWLVVLAPTTTTSSPAPSRVKGHPQPNCG